MLGSRYPGAQGSQVGSREFRWHETLREAEWSAPSPEGALLVSVGAPARRARYFSVRPTIQWESVRRRSMFNLPPSERSGFRKFQSKLIALIVIAGAVAISALVSMRLDSLRHESVLKVRAAYDRILEYDGLFAAMIDAETSMRGYLLTHDRALILPYTQAMEVLEERIQANRLHESASAQSAALEGHIRNSLRRIQALMAHADGGDSSGLYQRLVEERQAMDVVRVDLDRLQKQQLVRRDQEIAVRVNYSNWSRWTNVSVSLVTATLLIFLVVWIRRDLRLEEAQAAQIREQTVALSERQRTLAQLAHELALQNEGLAKANQALSVADRARARAIVSLQRRNRDLDQFAYITSHDLKAPLRAIGNITDWIEEDLGLNASPVVLGHLATMKQRAERMNALIEGILSYSRAGRLTAPVQLKVLDAVVNVATLLGVSERAWKFEGENLELTTDRTQFEQVLQNLIGNALKHGPSEETIEIGCREVNDDWVEVSVRDQGPGIDPRFHDRVFEMFQTLVPRDKFESTGIGLAIVKKIVTAHGGVATIESIPGPGAKFVFTWPRRLQGHADAHE